MLSKKRQGKIYLYVTVLWTLNFKFSVHVIAFMFHVTLWKAVLISVRKVSRYYLLILYDTYGSCELTPLWLRLIFNLVVNGLMMIY